MCVWRGGEGGGAGASVWGEALAWHRPCPHCPPTLVSLMSCNFLCPTHKIVGGHHSHSPVPPFHPALFLPPSQTLSSFCTPPPSCELQKQSLQAENQRGLQYAERRKRLTAATSAARKEVRRAQAQRAGLAKLAEEQRAEKTRAEEALTQVCVWGGKCENDDVCLCAEEMWWLCLLSRYFCPHLPQYPISTHSLIPSIPPPPHPRCPHP